MTLYETFMPSPMGELRLLADSTGLRGIYYQEHKHVPTLVSESAHDHPVLLEARKQLDEYFAGERKKFDVPLALHGTPFMLRVWEVLGKIPFGTTATYKQLAESIGAPKSSRAVGRAIALNPISIILPCHRVVGSSGKLTGYAGGLSCKEWLLKYEGRSV